MEYGAENGKVALANLCNSLLLCFIKRAGKGALEKLNLRRSSGNMFYGKKTGGNKRLAEETENKRSAVFLDDGKSEERR